MQGGGGLMLPITAALGLAIKQCSQPQQCAAINRRLVRGSDTGAHRLIKHPCGNTARRGVRHPDIDDVLQPAGSTAHFDVLPEKRMIRVEKPRKTSDVGSVERAS